jgi:hypothetical protein
MAISLVGDTVHAALTENSSLFNRYGGIAKIAFVHDFVHSWARHSNTDSSGVTTATEGQ